MFGGGDTTSADLLATEESHKDEEITNDILKLGKDNGPLENTFKLQRAISDGDLVTERYQTEERPRTYSSPDYVFTVYKKRWLILVAFFLLNYFQCVATICLTAFLLDLAQAFNAKSIFVTLANTSSALLFLPMFVIATQMFNTMSSRKALLICTIMIFIGAWLRPLAWINSHFFWIVIGQTIIGLSSPITTGAVSIIANNWFPDSERALATSIMSLSNPIGSFTSFVI